MTRRSLTPKQRRDMLAAQAGRCACGCGRAITLQNSDAEHGLPVGLGNAGKPDSLWHRDCHKGKTAQDRARMAKADRQRKAHLGLKKAQRPFPPKPPGYATQWPSRAIPSRPMKREARR